SDWSSDVCSSDLADLARELRVPAGHERRHLLVADLDELGVAARPVERAEERVDAVAGVAVDAMDTPLGQSLEDVISDQLSHSKPRPFVCARLVCTLSAHRRPLETRQPSAAFLSLSQQLIELHPEDEDEHREVDVRAEDEERGQEADPGLEVRDVAHP